MTAGSETSWPEIVFVSQTTHVFFMEQFSIERGE